MARDTSLDLEGKVIEVLRGDKFRVRLSNGHIILAHISGKMRLNRILIISDDRVIVELSPFDLGRGRIVYRYKD